MGSAGSSPNGTSPDRTEQNSVRRHSSIRGRTPPLVAGLPAVQHSVQFHQRMGRSVFGGARANSFSLSGSTTHVLARSAPTKAYIFWLEAIAQVLTIVCVRQFRKRHVFCSVDNVASEHSLQKGYSKDPYFTRLLGAFWTWVAASC